MRILLTHPDGQWPAVSASPKNHRGVSSSNEICFDERDELGEIGEGLSDGKELKILNRRVFRWTAGPVISMLEREQMTSHVPGYLKDGTAAQELVVNFEPAAYIKEDRAIGQEVLTVVEISAVKRTSIQRIEMIDTQINHPVDDVCSDTSKEHQGNDQKTRPHGNWRNRNGNRWNYLEIIFFCDNLQTLKFVICDKERLHIF